MSKKIKNDTVQTSLELHKFKITFTENKKRNPVTRSVVVESSDVTTAFKCFYSQFKNVIFNQIEALGKVDNKEHESIEVTNDNTTANTIE